MDKDNIKIQGHVGKWHVIDKKEHRGHKVDIVSYGDWDNPANVCLECEDCGEVVLDAEIYTLCAREDD